MNVRAARRMTLTHWLETGAMHSVSLCEFRPQTKRFVISLLA